MKKQIVALAAAFGLLLGGAVAAATHHSSLVSSSAGNHSATRAELTSFSGDYLYNVGTETYVEGDGSGQPVVLNSPSGAKTKFSTINALDDCYDGYNCWEIQDQTTKLCLKADPSVNDEVVELACNTSGSNTQFEEEWWGPAGELIGNDYWVETGESSDQYMYTDPCTAAEVCVGSEVPGGYSDWKAES